MRRLALRPGVTVEAFLDGLEPLITEATNIVPAAQHPSGAQQSYSRWVDNVERQIIASTGDAEFVQAFHSSRYWNIRDVHANQLTPLEMVEAEIRLQTARLQEAIDDLRERAARASSAPGAVVVMDTNVLLHYRPPAEVPWPDILQEKLVRIVLPLRVIEELDAKKYSPNKTLSKRARSLLPQLEKTLGAGGVPGRLREDVTIEVPNEGVARVRPPDADAEILEFCVQYERLSQRTIRMVTADTSMRIRAEAAGIRVSRPPEDFLRTKSEDDDSAGDGAG